MNAKLQISERIAERMNMPEALVRVSTKLLNESEFVEGRARYCFVICTNKLQGHEPGAYCLINLLAAVKDGDLVLVGEDVHSMSIMTLKKGPDYWACVPQPRSKLQPIILSGLEDMVIGKVEKVFDL